MDGGEPGKHYRTPDSLTDQEIERILDVIEEQKQENLLVLTVGVVAAHSIAEPLHRLF